MFAQVWCTSYNLLNNIMPLPLLVGTTVACLLNKNNNNDDDDADDINNNTDTLKQNNIGTVLWMKQTSHNNLMKLNGSFKN